MDELLPLNWSTSISDCRLSGAISLVTGPSRHHAKTSRSYYENSPTKTTIEDGRRLRITASKHSDFGIKRLIEIHLALKEDPGPVKPLTARIFHPNGMAETPVEAFVIMLGISSIPLVVGASSESGAVHAIPKSIVNREKHSYHEVIRHSYVANFKSTLH